MPKVKGITDKKPRLKTVDDLVESIRVNGVLIPIIVRKKETGQKSTYEILAGHNRTHGSKLAGRETIPAIVLENISDEDALAIVIETNLIQRSFSDMRHSEKAAAIPCIIPRCFHKASVTIF